ncbi:monooxygenase [bacterium]|nr:monooxygenase [bacterium]
MIASDESAAPTRAAPAQVLIVGAGPTGLVLALWLARSGVPVRIIDIKAGPGEASRAMVAHARTLEFYRQLGFADAVVAGGVRLEAIHLQKAGHQFAELPLRDMGTGITPFPFMLAYPQDDHERLLVEKLREAGVAVDWNTELVEFGPAEDRVRVTLRRDGNIDNVEYNYLCGCDGAHSRVRHGLGLSFVGGTYENLYYVADVQVEGGFRRDGFVNFAGDGFVLMLPVHSSGMQRLIGIVPSEHSGRNELKFDDVRGYAERLIGVRVTEVNWFSTYRVHHRVTEKFQVDRCFLAGDAAHVHSPVGGQGMNTGIGDAVNLAWKLASVVNGRAAPSLLDTYEPERHPFALSLVKTTDRVFALVAGHGLTGRLFRTAVLPFLVPAFVWFSRARRLLFRLVSQVRINYRGRPLAAGAVGTVHGGDRLPWVQGGDNFDPLRSREWQIHVYGKVDPQFRELAGGLALAIYEFPWSEAAGHAGLNRNGIYLVRPDGYVALACPTEARLSEFVARHRLKFDH